MIQESVENMLRTEQSTTFKINPRIHHAILGMADESGEMVSLAKRVIYYNSGMDLTNLKEELGDMWWYYSLALDEVARIEKKSPTTLFDEILLMNKAKLKARYPEKYSDELAQNRDLEKERKALEDSESKT